MNFHSFLIKYSEIAVKGKNRHLFEDRLVIRIREALARLEGEFRVSKASGRIYVDCAGSFDQQDVIEALQKVFGIVWICPLVKLADLGFDEILLTDCRYPQDSADCRGPRDRTAALETFCRRLQGALADRPVVLSAEGAEKAGALDPDSGQTPALLASFSGRVWGEGSEAGALAAFRPARLPGE